MRVEWQETDMRHTISIGDSGYRCLSWATDGAQWLDKFVSGLTPSEAWDLETSLFECRTPVRGITIIQEGA